MARVTCYNCKQEFTKEDEYQANFTESFGRFSHKMCPGTACSVCGEEIATYAQAKRRPASTSWMHKSCKLVLNLQPDDSEANPASWIARR